jgi:hypothetical protein
MANALLQQRQESSSTANPFSFPPGCLSVAFVENRPLRQYQQELSYWYSTNPPSGNPEVLLTKTVTSEGSLSQGQQTHENESPFYPLL